MWAVLLFATKAPNNHDHSKHNLTSFQHTCFSEFVYRYRNYAHSINMITPSLQGCLSDNACQRNLAKALHVISGRPGRFWPEPGTTASKEAPKIRQPRSKDCGRQLVEALG